MRNVSYSENNYAKCSSGEKSTSKAKKLQAVCRTRRQEKGTNFLTMQGFDAETTSTDRKLNFTLKLIFVATMKNFHNFSTHIISVIFAFTSYVLPRLSNTS